MPTSSSAATLDKRKLHINQNKSSARISDKTRAITAQHNKEKDFLTIGPALPLTNTLKSSSSKNKNVNIHKVESIENISLQVQQRGSTFKVSRDQKEKEKHPDRVCLDRRGLTVIPILENEPKLRLFSLQHNLINTLEGFKEQMFQFLVFLDIYDNQLEKIGFLENLENLRVLLLGKNRITKIEGLENLLKIEVLDLHGNQIQTVTNLSTLSELKVLNLAGNQIKIINQYDLQGLNSLQELNLRRNKIKKLLGFGSTPNLIKLYLSNNNVTNVEDMTSIIKSTNIKEISIDNNPVFLNGDCASFLISFLPLLTSLNSMQITEQVRKAAMIWRRKKESSSESFLDLSCNASLNGRREEVISNARTNWELLRSQTKCLTNCSVSIVKKLQPDADFILTSLSKPENRNVLKIKSKVATKVPALKEKKVVLRSGSQDTDNSQNTSSSNTSNSGEFFRLPPILVPIINKMEQKNQNVIKPSNSLSSIGPNIDSSVSSLNSTHSDSDSDSNLSDSKSIEESIKNDCNENPIKQPEPTPNIKEINLPKSSSNTDSSSNISTNTAISNVTIPSNSDLNPSSKSSSKSVSRSIKSATNSRLVHNSKTNVRAATAKPKKSSPVNAASKEREQGGDYLIEICGRYLNVYGQAALRFIDKPWSPSKANDVTTINFNYANFNGITPILSKIKMRFPNAENFNFQETNIQFIGQLNALAEIQGLVTLNIGEEGNPVVKKTSWRSYAIYRLSHWGLKIINGEKIEDEEIKLANEEYKSLSDLVLWSLPEPLLQPLLTRLHIDLSQTKEQSAKKWLLGVDPALRSVVSKEALQWKKGNVPQECLLSRQKAKIYCSSIIDLTCNAIKKLRLLDQQWPAILQEMVQNTLLDYSQLDMYMKKKLKELG
nr:leucine-rich repeat-containing protein 49 [Onthophagus taurus]